MNTNIYFYDFFLKTLLPFNAYTNIIKMCFFSDVFHLKHSIFRRAFLVLGNGLTNIINNFVLL